jgi:hypothetical protein
MAGQPPHEAGGYGMSADVTVLIPTRKRWSKLRRTLRTIPAPTGFALKTVVVVDGDPDLYENVKRQFPQMESYYLPGHNGSVRTRNFGAQFTEGHLCYATDDVDFMPGCIENAFRLLLEKFPDGDGVIGFHQDYSHHPTGCALIGSEFLKRYPRNYFLYPGYFHYACQEVMWLAERAGRFYYAIKECKIHHETPFRNATLTDQCHHDARKYRAEDHGIMDSREKLGECWGWDGQ